MPNWCLNRLEISGSEQAVAAVKDLVLNKAGNVDFEVLAPMPAPLEGLTNGYLDGIYGDFKGVPYYDFEFDTENPNRLSFCTPLAFSNKAYPLYQHVLEGRTSKDIHAMLERSSIIKSDVPIETSISQAVNEWRKIPENQRDPKDSPLRDDVVTMIFSILNADHEAFCKKTYGHEDSRTWTREEWGTKWNVDSTYETDGLKNGAFGCEFATAWCPPRAWISKLIAAVKAMENNDVSVTINYGEDGMWFGGEMGIKNGCDFNHTYSDEEIKAFFGDSLELFEDADE